MKLKQVAATSLLSFVALNSAHAYEFVVCRVYEFEELKTFSNDELQAKYNEYRYIYDKIGTTPPETAREVQEDFNDKQKCAGEAERIKRILDARAREESKAKPAGKKKG